MLSIIIILSIALAIFLGYRTKINTGLFCIVFAYIIGCFVMGLTKTGHRFLAYKHYVCYLVRFVIL